MWCIILLSSRSAQRKYQLSPRVQQQRQQQCGWAAAVAAVQTVAAEWAEFSDGWKLVWGQGTELPLCISPDCVAEWLGYVAAVTKINYSQCKTFFFLRLSLSLYCHTLFFIFSPFFVIFLLWQRIGWNPKVGHTKGRWCRPRRGVFHIISV